MSKFPPFKPQPKKGTCRERLGEKKTNSEINSNCTGWKYAENINIKLISDGVSSTNAVVVLSL